MVKSRKKLAIGLTASILCITSVVEIGRAHV